MCAVATHLELAFRWLGAGFTLPQQHPLLSLNAVSTQFAETGAFAACDHLYPTIMKLAANLHVRGGVASA